MSPACLGLATRTVQLGGIRAVLGRATTTPACTRPGQALQELYQPVVQHVPVYHPLHLHASNTVNDKPCLPGPSCVLPPPPSSAPPSNLLKTSQRASPTVSHLPAAQLTTPLFTNTDTTLQSLLPSMATQHHDYSGGFCGGGGNCDHIIQVSP